MKQSTLTPIWTGSYKQYRELLLIFNFPWLETRYVRSIEDIQGYHNTPIIRYGSWYVVDDADQMEAYCKAAGNPFITPEQFKKALDKSRPRF